jgi:hypothetical protein
VGEAAAFPKLVERNIKFGRTHVVADHFLGMMAGE